MDIMHWSAAPHDSLLDWLLGVHSSGVEGHYVSLLLFPRKSFMIFIMEAVTIIEIFMAIIFILIHI